MEQLKTIVTPKTDARPSNRKEISFGARSIRVLPPDLLPALVEHDQCGLHDLLHLDLFHGNTYVRAILDLNVVALEQRVDLDVL